MPANKWQISYNIITSFLLNTETGDACTLDLGVGFRKNEELIRQGQLSSKQWSDLKHELFLLDKSKNTTQRMYYI